MLARFLLAIVSTFSLSLGYAAEDVTSGLAKAVHSSQFLLSGNVEVVTVDGREYLVSVGVSHIGGNGSRATIAAMREAKLNAEEGLTKFVYGANTQTSESLTSTTTTERGGDGKTPHRNNRTESFVEKIRERSHGFLLNLIEIDKWKNQDGSAYFWAIAFLLPKD